MFENKWSKENIQTSFIRTGIKNIWLTKIWDRCQLLCKKKEFIYTLQFYQCDFVLSSVILYYFIWYSGYEYIHIYIFGVYIGDAIQDLFGTAYEYLIFDCIR